jgi:hypothetical protein
LGEFFGPKSEPKPSRGKKFHSVTYSWKIAASAQEWGVLRCERNSALMGEGQEGTLDDVVIPDPSGIVRSVRDRVVAPIPKVRRTTVL